MSDSVKLTVSCLFELPSAGQTRQTLRPYQSDLTGTPAAQNAVYAVGGEQRRGFTALPLAPVVDIVLKLTAHVDASVRLVSVTPVSLPLSPSLSLSLARTRGPALSSSSSPSFLSSQAGVSV